MFLNFLWGMETYRNFYIFYYRIFVFELPMRDGNTWNWALGGWLSWVFELPMRDGNSIWGITLLLRNEVFELPMRDGNWSPTCECRPGRYRFWTSYEGWKPDFTECGRLIKSFVFELPMRDGNRGIHTTLSPSLLVFELPMRDGNGYRPVYGQIINVVFELPMRDGNTTRVAPW